MNKKLIPLTVQLKQNNNDIIQGINQNDAGVVFDMRVMDGLVPFDFSGYSVVTLKIKKPDGTFTYDSDTGIYVDIVNPTKGKFKINIPTSCTAQNGMHFCKVGFSSSDNTLFETMTFNYFVGENPNADDDEVIGTNEFPVLTNLIAQIAGIISAENARAEAESDREDAETERQADYLAMMENLSTALTEAQTALANAQSMLQDVYEAIAQGGSVDVTDISALATKTYVGNQLKHLDFIYNTQTGQKDSSLKIFRSNESHISSIASQFGQGELAYASNTHKLFYSEGNGVLKQINEPCFIVGTTAPTDTSKLWIDTSGSAPIIKFFNSTAWVGCNTAVYG